MQQATIHTSSLADSKHLEKVLEDEDFLQQASSGFWEGSSPRFYGSSIPEQDSIPRNEVGFMTAPYPVSERLFDFPFHFLYVWGVLSIPRPVLFSSPTPPPTFYVPVLSRFSALNPC